MVSSDRGEYMVKNSEENWTRFYYQKKEVVRWKLEIGGEFTLELEIKQGCSIQDLAFFVCLQCMLNMGD